MRIYISGKITGLDYEVAKGYFCTVEEKLKEAGHIGINPMTLVPYKEGKTWEEYMLDDIKLLFSCDAIIMLENWLDSKGARMEHEIAKTHGLQIFYCKNHNFF